MAGTSAGRPGPQRQRTDDQCDPPGLARSTAQAGLVRLAGLRGRLEDCFGRAISAKSLDPRPSAPRTCGPAQSDSPAADMLGMTDSDRLRGGPTVRPTSTEVRHVNVPFSHPSEVYPQKDGRKVRWCWEGTFAFRRAPHGRLRTRPTRRPSAKIGTSSPRSVR